MQVDPTIEDRTYALKGLNRRFWQKKYVALFLFPFASTRLDLLIQLRDLLQLLWQEKGRGRFSGAFLELPLELEPSFLPSLCDEAEAGADDDDDDDADEAFPVFPLPPVYEVKKTWDGRKRRP